MRTLLMRQRCLGARPFFGQYKRIQQGKRGNTSTKKREKADDSGNPARFGGAKERVSESSPSIFRLKSDANSVMYAHLSKRAIQNEKPIKN